MRIGVVSDTHVTGEDQALPSAMIKAFKGVDLIVHAGDIVGMDTLEQLRSIGPEVKAVAGNMDSEAVKSALPQKEVFLAGKFKIAVMHGWGPPAALPELVLKELGGEKPDIIIFGHSHSPFNEKLSGILLFNPGSAMDRVYADYNSYGIIEIDNRIKAKIIKI